MTTFASKAYPSYATNEYDEITQHDSLLRLRVYTDARVDGQERCLKQGPIALAVNGVPFNSVYTSSGKLMSHLQAIHSMCLRPYCRDLSSVLSTLACAAE